ncbi:unnamed protein product [Cuscuta epithymum]|uniref:Phosphatidylinositol N-acetylglucosaminyltransferase subunit H conserved domain-containing protein n=1 Tax=Cuscuta epithymum TaxID=186058 RepID=A0AAV0DNC4_9ASTE|nr:unnamed protein product [Cuscuta epithymum]
MEGGRSSSITIGRYNYVHDVGKGPTEAIDVHHVMLPRNALPNASILLTFLLLSAYICSLFVLQVRSSAALLYSFLVVASLIWIYRKLVVRESVIIFPAFGVQIETQYQSGRIVRRFVPTCKIMKPVLNECVTPITCYWTLSLIIHGEEDLLLVFKVLRPSAKILVPIWKALCACVECGEGKEPV